MKRLLVIPAAGRGSRLGSHLPKALVPVSGKPMLAHVLDRYRALIDEFIVVVNPSMRAAVDMFFKERSESVFVCEQPTPTGMLDAILIPWNLVRERNPDQVWITWCDQIAVSRRTVGLVAEWLSSSAVLALPTVMQSPPYIHLQRAPNGVIERVLQRREGDAMPDTGESDAGLFAMPIATYLDMLPRFAQQGIIGANTGERNFLPFLAFASALGEVRTFSLSASFEAIGINTPDELKKVEDHLAHAEVL